MRQQQRENDRAAELAALPKGVVIYRGLQCRVDSALLGLQAIHCYSREVQTFDRSARSVDVGYSMATTGNATASAKFVKEELLRPQERQALNLLMPAISRGQTVIMVHAAKVTIVDISGGCCQAPALTRFRWQTRLIP